MQVIGTISGSGRVVLVDRNAQQGDPVPVDLDLEKVLGDMPNKTFKWARPGPVAQLLHSLHCNTPACVT